MEGDSNADILISVSHEYRENPVVLDEGLGVWGFSTVLPGSYSSCSCGWGWVAQRQLGPHIAE